MIHELGVRNDELLNKLLTNLFKDNVISVNDVPGSYPKVQCKYGDDSEQWIIEESFGVRMAPAPSNLIIVHDESDDEHGVPEIPKIEVQTSPTGLNFPAPPIDLNLTPQEDKVLEALDKDLGKDAKTNDPMQHRLCFLGISRSDISLLPGLNQCH